MISIGIVDDHAIVRSGLNAFLSREKDFRVVGEAASGREAIELARSVKIDVLLMDLTMPGQSGIDALAMVRAKAPRTRILILSGHPEEHYAVDLIRRGASGYVHKGDELGQIVKAIRTVAAGKRYISPAVGEMLAGQLSPPDGTPPHKLLTEREFQVLLKLARGETVMAIGAALSLSAKTVSSYRSRLMKKMDLTTNSELTYYVLKARLLE